MPEDVAVVGFDDMPWAESLHPPLTTVAQPAYELGATAARLLLERLQEPRRPATVGGASRPVSSFVRRAAPARRAVARRL